MTNNLSYLAGAKPKNYLKGVPFQKSKIAAGFKRAITFLSHALKALEKNKFI